MGFSLQSFINGLYDIMSDTSLTAEQERIELREAVIAGAEYAERCGQIKLPAKRV